MKLITYDLKSITEDPMTAPYAYVDGSFNPKTNVYGWGGYLYENGNVHPISGSGITPEVASMRNVAGEICGCLQAVELAQNLNIKGLTIYYDYLGIEKWATGEWKAKNPNTQDYATTMQSYMKNMSIHFVHVKGHTGVKGNEIADRMAKQAVGL